MLKTQPEDLGRAAVAVVVSWLAAVAAFAQPSAPPSTLAEAARRADVGAVRQLLDRGADPNSRGPSGSTALMNAVSTAARDAHGDPLATAKLLLERGADPKLEDPAGRTALHEASTAYASESRVIPVAEPLMELLLAAGADVNARASNGATALHQVAGQWASQPRTVKLLLDHGALLDLPDKEGRTALMFAAMADKSQIAALLCARGADGALRDSHGKTALDLAVEEGNPETAAALLPKGTEPRTGGPLRKARDRGLLRAISRSEVHRVGELLAQGANPNTTGDTGTPALVAAAENTSAGEAVRLLLDKGAAVNAAGPDGETALMTAARHYLHAVCEMLIAHGAAIDVRDVHGNSALMRAAEGSDSSMEERWQLVRLLLEKGADPKAANDSGVTALMLAAARATTPALEVLLDRGAEVDARDNTGRTALMVAVRQGGIDPVELLLDRKADVNARDHEGRSVLMAAIDAPENYSYRSNDKYLFEIFRLLIEGGAQVNVAGNDGDTPLLVAMRRHYWDAVELLVTRGADITVREKDGKTALELAAGTPAEKLLREAAGQRRIER